MLAAAAAVWVTLEADFLRYPGWLAAQKADLILGPVLVGLYWVSVRPASRFGLLLVAYGFVCTVYIAQSSSTPWLFGLGLVWESVIFLGNLLLILTFPNGLLRGIAAKVVLAGGVAVAALNVVLVLLLPQTGAGGAISGCREACPKNGLAFFPDPALALDLVKPFQIAVIDVAAATAALLLYRIATGTAAQRRALAIGNSVALVFLALQITFLTLSVLEADVPELQRTIQWAFTGARAAVWYGFLIALIAAQLFAWRVLQRLVRRSLRRPSQRELEAMLREPLADPRLELRFCSQKAQAWDGPVEPGPGRTVTLVERDGRPAAALIHDAQLNDDPELLQSAGVVALLAAENAELDTAWHDAVSDLRRSRARMSHAVDDERRRLSFDLHDGVQQRLSAIRIRIALATDLATDATLRGRLDEIAVNVEEAIGELREVSQGLYPHLLNDRGLLTALEHAVAPVQIRHNEIHRHSPVLELAIYYSCLEAVQNAVKHGGPAATIAVSLYESNGALTFEVNDDGPGFDLAALHEGAGLQNMHDRLGAVDGRLSIDSSPGRGTVVSGSVPLPVESRT